MRILQVVDSLDPIYGGPPTVVLRLAAALAREGAQVTLYSQERSGREADIAATLHGIPGIELVSRVSDVCDDRKARLLGRPAWTFCAGRAPHSIWCIFMGCGGPACGPSCENRSGARART